MVSPAGIDDRAKPNILRAGQEPPLWPVGATISWVIIVKQIDIALHLGDNFIHDRAQEADVYAGRKSMVIGRVHVGV